MKFKNLKFNAGLTFIELIVVIGIFAALSGIVLFNFTGFSTNISLQNLSNQIALQVKKAQTDAISGKNPTLFTGLSTLDESPVRPSYGVHFDAGTPNKFKYFMDLDNDRFYDSGLCDSQVQSNSECINDITIQTGDTVTGIAVDNYSGASNPCRSVVDITFKRPFPDAYFATENGSESVPNAGIEITSPKGTKKTIIVSSPGQIEIKNGPLSNYFALNTCI